VSKSADDAATRDADARVAEDRAAAAAAVDRKFRELRETGDRHLRNELIEEHRWVAVHCARRFDHRGEPLDDLIQVGQLGLLKAVNRFDPDVGVSFASYAIPTVMGELRRHFRDATWAIKVPRRVKDLHVDLGNAVDFLSGELGRPPVPQELAAHLGVSVDDVLEAIEAGGAYRTAPLVSANDDDDGRREATALRTDDAVLEGSDDRLLVRQLLDTLPDRERQIVELRFYGGLSQSEIAERVGVSQVHVSRLLRSSLSALQRAAGERAFD
jgi:RNA polymerase sigma-B factor